MIISTTDYTNFTNYFPTTGAKSQKLCTFAPSYNKQLNIKRYEHH